MSEKAPSGPKARFNQETGEWEDLRQAPTIEQAAPQEEVSSTETSGDSTTPLPEAPVIENDTEPTEPGTESTPDTVDSIESTTDSEVRYTDAEILGKRYPVRQMVRELSNQRMRMLETTTASWKNMLDTPGKFRLGLSRALAERRHTRQQKKFDAVAHLDDTNRLKARRQGKLEKAAARLNEKQTAYDSRTHRMQQRIDNIDIHSNERREQTINELRARREMALGRKATRHELRSQGASVLEARKILRSIPESHLTRVGSLAAMTAVDERRATKGSRGERRAVRQEVRAGAAIDKNQERVKQFAIEAKRADEIAAEIADTKLPAAEQQLANLRAERDATDASDANYQLIESQIAATEATITQLRTQDIPYWKNVAKDNRRQLINARATHADLQATWRNRQGKAATASEQTDAARATADSHRTAQRTAAQDAINS